MLDRAGRGEAVRSAHPVAAGQEEVALPILADGVAGIDMLGQAEIDGLGPGPLDRSAWMT